MEVGKNNSEYIPNLLASFFTNGNEYTQADIAKAQLYLLQHTINKETAGSLLAQIILGEDSTHWEAKMNTSDEWQPISEADFTSKLDEATIVGTSYITAYWITTAKENGCEITDFKAASLLENTYRNKREKLRFITESASMAEVEDEVLQAIDTKIAVLTSLRTALDEDPK